MENQRTINHCLIFGAIILHLVNLTVQTCDSTTCNCVSDLCTSCVSNNFNYDSLSKRCVPCGSNCNTCSSNGTCISCSSGYFLNNQTQFCEECITRFCSLCAGDRCEKCIDGYALSDTHDILKCVPCAVSNSETCNTESTVLTCKSGYWKNGDSCSPCRQFCTYCTSSTNCLSCADGFRPVISAGTYCAACPGGCKTCTQSACTTCFKNFRLSSGLCYSIQEGCNQIENCDSCEYLNSAVVCKQCKYPYYLLDGNCVIGSSLLCTNGSNGLSRYNCINSCSSSIQLSSLENSQLLCQPRYWIKLTDIIQYFYSANALETSFETLPFQSSERYLFSYQQLNEPVFYSSSTSSLKSIFTITKIFPPYYKLSIKIRAYPIYRTVSTDLDLLLTISMTDNTTNQFSTGVRNLIEESQNSYRSLYFEFQSKLIKDQSVTINLEAQITPESNKAGYSASNFPYGFLGYSQILIQAYRCSQECRICSNSKYCLQCYGQLFLYQNKCMESCYGLFQFYAPYGNSSNYTYKVCLQQCPSGFYSSLSLTKVGIYECLPCSNNCKTCKSEIQCLSCSSPLIYYSLGFSCLQSCPFTHYNQSNVCTPCRSPCKSCLSESLCLSCSIGYFQKSLQQCVHLCPLGTFQNITIRQCQNCSEKCIECTSSAEVCTSCKNQYFLLDRSCVDACPERTHYSQNNYCKLCTMPCFQCISKTECLSCASGYLLNNTCFDVCPKGYYKNITQQICSECDPSCQSCLSFSSCQSCKEGFFLFGSQCLVQCPAKTYSSNTSNFCLPCIQPCLQCQSSDFCLTCLIGYLSQLEPGACLINCQEGFYEALTTSNSRQCLPCSSYCLTCSSETKCITCSNLSEVLYENQCRAQCPSGYYELENECQTCSYPCSTCQQRSQKCLSCESPYLYYENTCIYQCSLSQYQANGQCFSCLYPCKSCLSQSECTSCSEGGEMNNQTFLFENQCIEVCPDGFYSDQFTYKCRSCNYPCSKCLDSSTCLSCQSGYLTQQNRCEICPPTYFPNTTSQECQLCNSSISFCEACYSSEICRYCQSGYYLYTQNAVTRCITENECLLKSGYFKNDQQMSCAKCMLPCGECLSISKCKTCLTGYLYETKCLLQCPDGYYEEALSHTCQSCNEQICLACTSSPITCTKCNQNGQYPVLLTTDRLCIRQVDCPSGYYIDTSYGYKRCLKCQPPCLTCTGIRKCLSCITGILHDQQCRVSCPITYFELEDPDTQIMKCSLCSEPCLSCRQSSESCTTCISSYYLQQTSCLVECSDGYFLEENTLQCKKCESPCQQCESLNICLTCLDASLILYYGQCISSCPDGNFKNLVLNECQDCPEECQLCQQINGTVQCQKCANGYFMSSEQFGLCQVTCQEFEYSDLYSRECHSCQSPCKACLSAIKCTSCIDEYLLYGVECVRGPLCPINTFRLSNRSECVDRCQVQQQFGETVTRKCVHDCLYEYVKDPITKTCLPECPQNYYLTFNKMCSPCDQQKSGFCDTLLKMSINAKSIFNVLYMRVIFSEGVEVSTLQPQMIRIQYKELYLREKRRMLVEESVQLQFEVYKVIEPDTVWIKILGSKSLSEVQFKFNLASHYIFPGKILQHVNATTVLASYDQYSEQDIQNGQIFQSYSQAVSILMCICLVINLIFNTGYLTYSMVDYYQFIFILLYINVDYPPALNHFLYGFRYAHYLFLPQIFQVEVPLSSSSNTPQKFGIIVSDASFLNNTGHDFLLIFIAVAVLLFFKLIEIIMSCYMKHKKSNRITNSVDGQSKQKSKNEEQVESSSEKSQKEEEVEISNRGLKIIQLVINRFKFNYFNDFLYLVYFYLVMFAFAQTYNMTPGENAHYASIIFAVLFMVLGTVWPFLLAIIVYYKIKHESIFCISEAKSDEQSDQVMEGTENEMYKEDSIKKEQQKANNQLNPAYFCFYAEIKHSYDNKVGLYLPVIHYARKYCLAITFVFCSSYPMFIMGIIISSSILLTITKIIYRPFNNKIPFINAIASECLFVVSCLVMTFGIIVNNSGSTNLQISEEDALLTKMGISKFCIACFIILSIFLAVYNVAMIIIFFLKRIGKEDFYSKYNEAQIYTTISDRKEYEGAQNSGSSNSAENEQAEQSNMRLNLSRQSNKSKNKREIVKKGSDIERESSQSSDEFGMHLVQNKQSPQLLIKCIKGQLGGNEDDENSEEDKEEEQSQEHQEQGYKEQEEQEESRREDQQREVDEVKQVKKGPQVFEIDEF